MPTASLALLGVMTLLSFGAAAAGLGDMQFQIGAASACFTAVTAFGLFAGIRLLPARTPAWCGVIVAAAVMLAVLLFSGWALVAPLGLAVAAILAGRRAGPEVLPMGRSKMPTSAGRRETVPAVARPLGRP
ncbi:hypothetical protein [Arthrobacter sp. H16F315]|uniref:hypothetical protein n=1 Tax=Arthrobacter sp. H16F315 TaxID=2955314 RepID=UPI0020968AF9|nr:hypothetical protein [Arthrobacter sp. H16F315]MDD1476364.1 hypothetical protein [Arthrobacter sp. H16F315]